MQIEVVFADVIPIKSDDGPNPIAPIAYPHECKTQLSSSVYYYFFDLIIDDRLESYGLFSCVCKSKRAVSENLTTEIIELNPAHYTVWKVRQDCLFTLNINLREELEYATEIGFDHHKNYQIWHHREVIVTKIGLTNDELKEKVLSTEIDYINKQFETDAKNYHAWSYRQWLVRHFNIWGRELDDINRLIESDFRNNSAWNHRFFYFTNNPEGFSPEHVKSEIDFAMVYNMKAPNNESSWNYLKGIVKIGNLKTESQNALELQIKALIVQNEFVVHGAAFLLGLLEIKIDEETDETRKVEVCSEARQLCLDLVKFDIIRLKFWNYRMSLIQV
ncbi:CAAX geranylgeranyltransferase alpha subunit [Physocladia obscura]|uniref:Protein farnesyltransferase/geranylgeranyltransferase type-1 subunit alpha n=1 Tax=Physocladia obscura TaxID=109957 RepID=A0AAD5T4U5_9FUNG|nr:CAAX geranylgeranyltransferase alpha subunit [Physocladia obscura]